MYAGTRARRGSGLAGGGFADAFGPSFFENLQTVAAGGTLPPPPPVEPGSYLRIVGSEVNERAGTITYLWSDGNKTTVPLNDPVMIATLENQTALDNRVRAQGQDPERPYAGASAPQVELGLEYGPYPLEAGLGTQLGLGAWLVIGAGLLIYAGTVRGGLKPRRRDYGRRGMP